MTEAKVTEVNAKNMGFVVEGMGWIAGDELTMDSSNPDSTGSSSSDGFKTIDVGSGSYDVSKVFTPNAPVVAIPAKEMDTKDRDSDKENDKTGTEKVD